ncbi:hypothetical protein L4174_017355 [Photobacterium sp. CCB-ST2H9]|uniref:hypothetical protein n=1 Tax=Photobacterium sp. CCB-ST2H9 TaxID=2912855 RepID=UPI002004CE76|nr:hypothetical protein [Photobacterium sp. CCB-ST2H9]UTM59839.1 hypothetical protein L4174_017355 [Photobacterium sp. CCB-ST2H9]
MKKRKIAAALTGGCVLLWGAAALWPEKQFQTQITPDETPERTPEKMKQEAGPRGETMTRGAISENHEHSELSTEPELRLPVEMKTQFAVLSKVYAAELAYPAYSRPITAQDKQWLEPNRYMPVKAPVLDGEDSAALVLKKYRHFFPEDIRLSIQSGLPVAAMTVELFDLQTHQRLTGKKTLENQVVFPSEEHWPDEIRAKATVDFSTGTDILTADFQFFVPVAEVTQVAKPVISGANVEIPVMLTVKKAGIYRIRANLFTASGQPVAVLTAKQTLAAGEQIMTLQAYHQVFAGAGEFELRTFQVEKMSGFPGEKSQYGISQQPGWPLGYIDTSLLSDEPYVPTKAEQQRMNFLESAASG